MKYMQELKIESLRNQIDKIDNQLVGLLTKRFGLVKIIGQIKLENKIPVIDNNREQEIVDRLFRESGLDKKFVTQLFTLIFKESRKQQRRKK